MVGHIVNLCYVRSSSPKEKGTLQLSAHVYCGQTVAHLSYCCAVAVTDTAHSAVFFLNLAQRRYFNYDGNTFVDKWRKGSAASAYTVIVCIGVTDFGQFAFDVYRAESRCWRMRSTLYHAMVVVACTLAAPRQILAGQQAMLLNLAIVRSNGTMHTSAKAGLTSVVVRIRIRIRIRIMIRVPVIRIATKI